MTANEDSMILEGYAAMYESPTVLYEIDGIEYKEVIERGAFDNMNTKDCCLKYNHSNNVPILARTRGGSLELYPDEIGLRFKSTLFNTQTAKDVYTLVRDGGLDKCSFAFTIKDEEYCRETRTRHIKSIDRLLDVAIVDIPAYESTCVQARDFFSSEINKEKMIEVEKRKKELLLRTYF